MKELKEHEQLLQEAYTNVLSEQSPIASKLMNMAQDAGNKLFNEKKQACRKHMGFVKAFKEAERLQLMACVGRAKAAGARRAASLLDKAKGKCGKEKHCRDSLNHYIDQLRKFAKHEEFLSAGDDAKLAKLKAKAKAKAKRGY